MQRRSFTRWWCNQLLRLSLLTTHWSFHPQKGRKARSRKVRKQAFEKKKKVFFFRLCLGCCAAFCGVVRVFLELPLIALVLLVSAEASLSSSSEVKKNEVLCSGPQYFANSAESRACPLHPPPLAASEENDWRSSLRLNASATRIRGNSRRFFSVVCSHGG